ncbi:MAG: EVE domain-containing protein [Myxococcota bacterium]
MKTEPSSYAWSDLVRDDETCWDGVRNHAARLHLLAMALGDRVLVYHSGRERQAVGLAQVTREAYPDPTADDRRWVAVDLRATRPLVRPVPLARVKAEPSLREIALVRQSRLSVMPLEPRAFRRILELAGTRL